MQKSAPHQSDSTPQGVSPLEAQQSSSVTVPKRHDYISWDDYFLAVALLSAKRSKDPQSPSGACIVDNKNRIVGIGYNGLPQGCSDEVFPWTDGSGDDQVDWLHTKNPYVCHAITNAILNKCSNDVVGCRIYVLEYPNSDCSKMVIQSGIQEVMILGKEPELDTSSADLQASQILLEMAGVTVRYCPPEVPSLILDFAAKQNPEAPMIESDPLLEEAQKIARESERETSMKYLMEEANYDVTKVLDNGRRKDSLSWQDYFMAMAFLTAQRSKDPNTQVGACIVDSSKRIIGLGYNGFPSGCSDDKLPWARSNSNALDNKYLYVCHAEVNAVLNKGSANVKGATLYVALFPCENCSKMIIQSGIREVVYMNDTYHDTPGCRASRIMFQCAGVKLRQYIPSMAQLRLDLATSC
eukprot:Nitzschia sp. Nitz4//scaffold2_size372955//165836//167222//NITZ4_000416-RA/size372955-snap-gene-0.28-mRNA-1//1//CDS//3329546757//4555//frame0